MILCLRVYESCSSLKDIRNLFANIFWVYTKLIYTPNATHRQSMRVVDFDDDDFLCSYQTVDLNT